jgi:hypothetical protein
METKKGIVMSSLNSFNTGQGAANRHSHHPPVTGQKFVTQSTRFQPPSFPFQPLPPPKGPAPYRYDLSQLLPPDDLQKIITSGVLVCHAVGDTGDFRGQQKEFVAELLTQDAQNLHPAFFYHLGDIVYFAGDVNLYGDNFYATYQDYPGFIVAIPGNHDCQPDDPQDGPVDPNKYPLDGWIQNFMSPSPGQLGSRKTGVGRTQMDLPNVFWTFTTPFATIIGLFSNVGETQGEIHQNQIDWFKGELAAADPSLALVVAVHHPPFSGDTEHSGSSAIYQVLFDAFAAVNRYPHLILSGHVHNFQRFTQNVTTPAGELQIPCVVAGAGGYSKLGKLLKIDGQYPAAPLPLPNGLTLEQYDQDNFGFLRLEITTTEIVGTYLSSPYATSGTPTAQIVDHFAIDLVNHTVKTLS